MQRILNPQKHTFFRWGAAFAAKKEKVQIDPIVLEIKEVLSEIEAVNSKFQFETEEQIIDSLIYEQRALKARYNFLIGDAKRKGVICTPLLNLISKE